VVCGQLRASLEMCGDDAGFALDWLRRLEVETRP
jgi:hypothetical protein